MNIECAKERMDTVQYINESADYIRYNYADAVAKLLDVTLEQHISTSSISLEDWYVAFTDYLKGTGKRDAFVATKLKEHSQNKLGIEENSHFESFLMDVLLHLSTLKESKGEITSIMLDDEFISNSKLEHLIIRLMYKALRNEFREVFVEEFQYDLIKYVIPVYFKHELPFILENVNEYFGTDDEEYLFELFQQEVNVLHNITVQDELLVYLHDLQVVNGSFKGACTRNKNDILNSMGLDGELGVLEDVYEKLLYFEEIFSKLSFIYSLTDQKHHSMNLKDEENEIIQRLSILWKDLIEKYQEKTMELIQCFVTNYEMLKMKKELAA